MGQEWIRSADIVVRDCFVLVCFCAISMSTSAVAAVSLEKVAKWKNDATAAYSIIHDDFGAYYPLSNDGIYQHYNELNIRGLQAGFGVIVQHVEEWKPYYYDIMAQMVAEGHEIINHSYLHTDLTSGGG